ncbi:MAG: pantoate--beta-alanine ligase [Firmicutes bacterium]|nr:pantoate--beta-alanine ligase [Bacillota bacterium]
MDIIESAGELRARLHDARMAGARIGLVPTMGYLHEGHVSLFRQAVLQCDLVVASLFVNPLQFGPSEDFAVYPRRPEADARIAANASVDVLFMPSTEEMYPQPPVVSLTLQGIHDHLCGRSRPGHFEGVATVVAKLFNLVQPHVAYFGQKDAQQLAVVRRLVRDLNYAIEVIGCPIVRDVDGLALSSRNVYLSDLERPQAAVLRRSLLLAEQLVSQGETDVQELLRQVREVIGSAALATIDYVEVVDPDTLTPLTRLAGSGLLALAVFFGRTRLIDNTLLCVPTP